MGNQSRSRFFSMHIMKKSYWSLQRRPHQTLTHTWMELRSLLWVLSIRLLVDCIDQWGWLKDRADIHTLLTHTHTSLTSFNWQWIVLTVVAIMIMMIAITIKHIADGNAVLFILSLVYRRTPQCMNKISIVSYRTCCGDKNVLSPSRRMTQFAHKFKRIIGVNFI